METNPSKESTEEPNPKRPKMESEVSTSSSKPETKDPFHSLPPDILPKIIGYIPVAQWPSLELLDKHFLAESLIAWRQLRNVNLDREFLIKSSSPSEISTLIESIVQKLIEHSPYLRSLSGIGLQSNDAALNSDVIQLIVQFEHLESITLGDVKYFGSRRGMPLENAIEFLELTRSRASLKELRLFNVDELGTDPATILDRFASSFTNGGSEIRAPLKLEKFSFSSQAPLLCIRLDTMDTTRLTELRVGKAKIETDQLTNLIERAPNLRLIELAFLCCARQGLGNCNGPRLRANKELLTALANHENLTAISFDYFGSRNCSCKHFHHEFIEMLKAIGRRGQLRKLALDQYFAVNTPAIRMEEICATIRDYLPYLQSIKLNVEGISDGVMSDIVTAHLREIRFTAMYDRLTAGALKKMSQLPHLKRLALDALDFEDSLGCLADAKTLTDLRMGNTELIGADVFMKWSEGFASNLERLMLWESNEDADYDEDGLVRLLENAVRLRVLILYGGITDKSLTAIAKSCPKLEILGVQSPSNKITVQPLQEIVDRCTKLRKLGGFGVEIRKKLQFPKYRKIGDVDINFNDHEFDDDEYA